MNFHENKTNERLTEEIKKHKTALERLLKMEKFHKTLLKELVNEQMSRGTI